MSALNQQWRNLFFTLLVGLIASVTSFSVLADTIIANASASYNLSGVSPLVPFFDGNLSTCVSSYSCQWHWTYGDGSSSDPAVDATGSRSSSHTYRVAGTYTVTLTVTIMVPTGTKPKATTSLQVTVQQGESLNSYVNTCKQQLGFNDADIPTNLNCATGVLFAPPNPPVNDFFGYARVNNDVDLAFACRWVNNGNATGDLFTPPFVQAASIELLVNNHRTGKTCFFKARDQILQPNGNTTFISPSIAIVSPTVAANAAPNTTQANYWDLPIELDRSTPCADCHVAGPYIATPRIVPFLAQFGVLNNGHDTYGRYLDSSNHPAGNYQIVGSTFAHFNDLALSNNVPVGDTCTLGCHSIGYNSLTGDINLGRNTLIPGITSVIDINGAGPTDISISAAGVMRPYNDDSNYRWINRDVPGDDGAEVETFTSSKSFPASQLSCGVPTVLEAHTVGSTANFSTTDLAGLPDKLSIFNAREGLVCLSSDQPGGRQCNNYSVKYQCSDGSWSGVYDVDSPTFGGDYEQRTSQANVCSSKPGMTAIAIQATVAVNGVTKIINGPADRLAQFSPTGLVCRNSEQPNGASCSNYVVRYRGCQAPSQATLVKLKSAWVNPPTFSDRFLTTTNTSSGSETRAQGNNYQYPSQDWVVEFGSGGVVRLKDVWSGKYLTATSTAEQATVVVQNTNAGLTLQQWVIESVSGITTEKRLRNIGSGRYLTVGNYTSDPYYAPMYSQSLSNQNWTSQRWLIQ